MADSVETIETSLLEQKHKKEKKELQAQIQALKKAAKNDKTKKKELIAEIAKLETDLEKRQKKELDLLDESQSVDNTIDPLDNNEKEDNDFTKQKVSKAQKRRDKKLQQERDREKEIKFQEQENLHGPRNTESQLLSTRLQQRKLKIYAIPSDGDCLYKAVAHQLETKCNKTISVDNLRMDVATYIQENKDEFMPFMCNPDTGLNLTDGEFENYCHNIRTTKVWGGHIEIQALSKCLKCPITVVQATGPTAIDQGTEFSGTPLVIVYHRYLYSLGEHYNSTEIQIEDDT